MKKVLLLSGKQGSGKTSNAILIKKTCETLGYDITLFKFADFLYTMHDQCLPFLKQWGMRPAGMIKDGDLLQVLGTEYGRKHLGEDVWARALHRKVLDFLSRDTHGKRLALIDDARFENEFDIFSDMAFKVRLDCIEGVRKVRASHWRENTAHASETGLDDYVRRAKFDLVISSEFASKEAISHMIRVKWFNNETAI